MCDLLPSKNRDETGTSRGRKDTGNYLTLLLLGNPTDGTSDNSILSRKRELVVTKRTGKESLVKDSNRTCKTVKSRG